MKRSRSCSETTKLGCIFLLFMLVQCTLSHHPEFDSLRVQAIDFTEMSKKVTFLVARFLSVNQWVTNNCRIQEHGLRLCPSKPLHELGYGLRIPGVRSAPHELLAKTPDWCRSASWPWVLTRLAHRALFFACKCRPRRCTPSYVGSQRLPCLEGRMHWLVPPRVLTQRTPRNQLTLSALFVHVLEGIRQCITEHQPFMVAIDHTQLHLLRLDLMQAPKQIG